MAARVEALKACCTARSTVLFLDFEKKDRASELKLVKQLGGVIWYAGENKAFALKCFENEIAMTYIWEQTINRHNTTESKDLSMVHTPYLQGILEKRKAGKYPLKTIDDPSETEKLFILVGTGVAVDLESYKAKMAKGLYKMEWIQ